MSKNLDESGLKSIFSEYDLFFIDIWGVVHNGIKLHENAVKVLNELSNNEKKFILLTNAPRPNLTVVNTLIAFSYNFIPLWTTTQISMKNKSYSLTIDFKPDSSKFLLIFQI